MLLFPNVDFELLVLVEKSQKLVIVSLTLAPLLFELVVHLLVLGPFLSYFALDLLDLGFVLVVLLGLLDQSQLDVVGDFLVLEDLFVVLDFLLATLDGVGDGCGVLVRVLDGVDVVQQKLFLLVLRTDAFHLFLNGFVPLFDLRIVCVSLHLRQTVLFSRKRRVSQIGTASL